jgi:hypothetical protein
VETESISILIKDCGWFISPWNHSGFPGRSVAMVHGIISPEEAKCLMLSAKDDGNITLTDGAKTVFTRYLGDPDCFDGLKECLNQYVQG